LKPVILKREKDYNNRDLWIKKPCHTLKLNLRFDESDAVYGPTSPSAPIKNINKP
jgi:hypothetical protein